MIAAAVNLTLELIRIFHAAVSDGKAVEDPVEVNRLALMAGYIVEPMACTEAVFEAMKCSLDNYKSTFYRDFEDVLSRTRLDLLVDQMLHYMSTYGTNYRSETFTLNPTPEAMAYKKLTPIRAVSAEKMFELCMEMINSGSALKLTTLTPVTEYISRYLSLEQNADKRAAFDISVIRNREARFMLYNKLGVLPEDPIEFLCTAAYCATGNPMLINSREYRDSLRNGARNSLRCLEMFGTRLPDKLKEGLASIYFRFADFFITFKQSFRAISATSPKAAAAVKLINYLRHLAPRCKKPFRKDLLSDILAYGEDMDKVRRAIEKETSAYRLIRILGYLQMTKNEPEVIQYLIRNGKIFIRTFTRCPGMDWKSITARNLIPLLRTEIVSRLRKNVEGKSVRFPDNIQLTAPTSEKNFVGNFPFFSSFKVTTGAFIGVYWRNEWGTRDFDLSYIDKNGGKIGWDSSFYTPNAGVVFSGDMTNADPEASEILFFQRSVPDGFVFVNRFNGAQGSRFRLFFGEGNPLAAGKRKKSRLQKENLSQESDLIRGSEFHVNRMDIHLEADVISDTAEQLVGFIKDGCFYFMTSGIGNNTVSSAVGRKYSLYDALATRHMSAVDLKSLLLEAGVIEVSDSETEVDIDLSSRIIDRTSIINLFSDKER